MRTADVTGSDHPMTSSTLHVRRGPEVRQYVIHVTRQGRWRLAETELSFPTLASLVAYYCDARCAMSSAEKFVVPPSRCRSVITSAKEVMFSWLFVCLSVSKFAQKLPNGFA